LPAAAASAAATVAVAAEVEILAVSVAIDEASLSSNLTIEPIFSEREIFVFALDKEVSELLFTFFLAVAE
jgi:hypothetical protein